jgi:hypothetical protein
MVMTEWMREVRKALETIPKDTPNRLKAAMEKAKLTYKKGSSTSAASHSMKKSHKHHKRGRSRGNKSRKGMRKHRGKKSKRHYKGGMSKLNPSNYDGGKGVGTSGVNVQIGATTKSA